MQDPDSINAAESQPQESDEISRLRAELERLQDKLAQTNDADIASVLGMRIKEILTTLSTQAAPIDEEDEPPESEEIQKLRLELEKLQDKRAKTKDKNVIAVLDMRIMQIQPTLPPVRKTKAAKQAEAAAKKEKEEEAVVQIPLPTADEAEKAEKLIKQSMLEKRRGNVVGATDLLKKAAEVAPGSAVVLEALGDDLLERKLTKLARETYKRALKLDPKNVGLERKYAQTVLQSTGTMSVEDQLRYGMSDSMFITGEDNVAGLWPARLLTAFVPGVGQMVLGKTVKGAVLLGAWAICFILLAIWHSDFEALIHSFLPHKGPVESPNMRVLLPMIGMLAVWIGAVGDLFSGKGGGGARNSKVDRPKPPVDLPFD